MQKELQLSPEVRQDLKLARRAYLTQLGFIIRERQDLVRSLSGNMPNGGNHSSTSTRQAAPPVLVDLQPIQLAVSLLQSLSGIIESSWLLPLWEQVGMNDAANLCAWPSLVSQGNQSGTQPGQAQGLSFTMCMSQVQSSHVWIYAV